MKMGNPLARMIPFLVAALGSESAPTAQPIQYHGSGGPTGRMVGKRRRMTCRPQYNGKLNRPGHFDES